MSSLNMVYVVDDDISMRELMQVTLEAAGFGVNTYESVEALVEAGVCVRSRRVQDFKEGESRCLLLDLEMPGTSGLQFLEKLRQDAVELGEGAVPCPIIVVTGRASVEAAVKSMKLGAMDLFQKPFVPEALVKLVRETLEKNRMALAAAVEREGIRDRIGQLSPREREFLEAIVQGQSTKMIANTLNISARTVDHHRANLMEKMKADNVADLVRIAMKADYRSVK